MLIKVMLVIVEGEENDQRIMVVTVCTREETDELDIEEFQVTE